MVILIIAFVLATITSLIFFDGIIGRTHLIANKKEHSNNASSSNSDKFSEVINHFSIF